MRGLRHKVAHVGGVLEVWRVLGSCWTLGVGLEGFRVLGSCWTCLRVDIARLERHPSGTPPADWLGGHAGGKVCCLARPGVAVGGARITKRK